MSVEGVGRGGGGNADAVNAVMMQAVSKSMEAAEKLMKFTVSASVGAEIGKGGQVDVSA